VHDIVDMDGLMRHFGGTPGFWDGLPERAALLGLAEPLALACHFSQLWLGTPIPPAAQSAIALQGPVRMRRRWLRALTSHALRPAEPDDSDSLAKRGSATLLLARYHWHRMPLVWLVPHLWRKWRAAGAAGGGANDGADGRQHQPGEDGRVVEK
jgi:hypothetical protein